LPAYLRSLTVQKRLVKATWQRTNTTFALCHSHLPSVHINNKPIFNSDTVKYFGLTYNKRLTWAKYIHTIKLKLNQRLTQTHSRKILKTKIHIYNLILKPIWLYSIQIWGTAKISNTEKIQVSQSNVHSLIINAPH